MIDGAAATWQFTPHACRHCGGRVMRSGILFMCATCEVRCEHRPDGICGCGILPGARPAGMAFGPFTCVPNPARGPSNPAAIGIRYGAEEPTPAAAAAARGGALTP